MQLIKLSLTLFVLRESCYWFVLVALRVEGLLYCHEKYHLLLLSNLPLPPQPSYLHRINVPSPKHRFLNDKVAIASIFFYFKIGQ